MGTTVTLGYQVDDTGTATSAGAESGSNECLRETSLLYLLLTLGTAWLGLSLYNFTKTYVISLEPAAHHTVVFVIIVIIRLIICPMQCIAALDRI